MNELKEFLEKNPAWRWVIAFLIFCGIMYFLTGGSLFGDDKEEVARCSESCVSDMDDCITTSQIYSVQSAYISESDYEDCFNDLDSCVSECGE